MAVRGAAAVLAVVLVAGAGGFLLQARGGPVAVLPATPRGWLDAYEAAAVDNPPRVCSQLFSAQLAAVYARAARGSCRRYFARITSSSVTVQRVFEDGATAVLYLRMTVGHAGWAVVLDHRSAGWQAGTF